MYRIGRWIIAIIWLGYLYAFICGFRSVSIHISLLSFTFSYFVFVDPSRHALPSFSDMLGNDDDDDEVDTEKQITMEIDDTDYINGPGLFEQKITKFDALPIEEQIQKIHEIPEVVTYDHDSKSFVCSLKPDKRAVIEEKPNVCLGNSAVIYRQAYHNGNYYECVRIIIAALEHGGIFLE